MSEQTCNRWKYLRPNANGPGAPNPNPPGPMPAPTAEFLTFTASCCRKCVWVHVRFFGYMVVCPHCSSTFRAIADWDVS